MNTQVSIYYVAVQMIVHTLYSVSRMEMVATVKKQGVVAIHHAYTLIHRIIDATIYCRFTILEIFPVFKDNIKTAIGTATVYDYVFYLIKERLGYNTFYRPFQAFFVVQVYRYNAYFHLIYIFRLLYLIKEATFSYLQLFAENKVANKRSRIIRRNHRTVFVTKVSCVPCKLADGLLWLLFFYV